MIQKNTADFLAGLRLNNSKDWFDTNRARYEAAKADILQLAGYLLGAMAEQEPDLLPLSAKDCVFRINRDVRFSADKSPYKTNMGFLMNSGGKKAPSAGYYVHIEPGGNSFIAAGMYAPSTAILKLVRTEILYGFDAFRAIISEPGFKTWFPTVEYQNHKSARVPKGLDPNHPAAEYLRLKSFIGVLPISDEELCRAETIRKVRSAFTAAVPFVRFLNLALLDHQASEE